MLVDFAGRGWHLERHKRWDTFAQCSFFVLLLGASETPTYFCLVVVSMLAAVVIAVTQ